MKIENQEIKVASILGRCTDDVKLPNGEKGFIEFRFEFSPEYEIMNVSNGNLRIGDRTNIVFSKVGAYYGRLVGDYIEDFSPSDFILDYIGNLMEKLKGAEVEAKIKKL